MNNLKNTLAQLDDSALAQLLLSVWRAGFDTSTERCNGEFPYGLEDDGQADILEILASVTKEPVR